MYRILFVDEQQEDIDIFKDYIEEKDSEGNFEVLSMYPLESLEKMIEEIMNMHIDAVITDSSLNEYKENIDYNVSYDGTQLVEKIMNEREDFPCFVLTSFDDEAIGKSEDVNIVYIKGILHGTEKDTKAKANFLDRLKHQIIHYRSKLDRAENRLIELLKKSEKEKLNAAEEEEVLRLDSFIEKALDKKSLVPEIMKKNTESESLLNLLKAVDDLKKKLTSNE
jgi:DNA-binding NarL/FixJ family response regulator